MYYLVKTVVAHMRSIELTEMELIALFGMFIWSDCEWKAGKEGTYIIGYFG